MPITNVKTMIIPARPTSVAISSRSLFFRICVITVIRIPIAAILKSIEISIAYNMMTKRINPMRNPNLI